MCVGEEHPNPHHHWLQLHVVRELIQRLPRGARLALAMEMFQRPFQGVLDDYAARRIDAAALIHPVAASSDVEPAFDALARDQ